MPTDKQLVPILLRQEFTAIRALRSLFTVFRPISIPPDFLQFLEVGLQFPIFLQPPFLWMIAEEFTVQVGEGIPIIFRAMKMAIPSDYPLRLPAEIKPQMVLIFTFWFWRKMLRPLYLEHILVIPKVWVIMWMGEPAGLTNGALFTNLYAQAAAVFLLFLLRPVWFQILINQAIATTQSLFTIFQNYRHGTMPHPQVVVCPLL